MSTTERLDPDAVLLRQECITAIIFWPRHDRTLKMSEDLALSSRLPDPFEGARVKILKILHHYAIHRCDMYRHSLF